MKQFWRQFFLFQPIPDPAWTRGRKIGYYAYRAMLLLCAGLCMGLVLLTTLAIGPYSGATARSATYLSQMPLAALNAVPVALLVLLFYAVTGRAWSAFLLGGGISFGFCLGNYYKLFFRDDPLLFEDMLILNEAKTMAGGGHYALFLDKWIIVSLFCLILGTVLLMLLAPAKKRGWRPRAASAAAAAAVAAALLPVYLDGPLYDSIVVYGDLNEWNPTQNYIAHGFVYPFIHSVNDFRAAPPEGYSKAKAEALLAPYTGADIPAGKQISIIGIMREAYADFSRYSIEGLDISGYDVYHALEAESYTGDLVLNIFAGGTVDTERGFLTGEYRLRNFRGNVNSYAWYLRGQGYATEGSHPYYQWYYNRQNVNGYMGFERYRFLEDDYEKLTNGSFLPDAVLLSEIYEDFQAAPKPCFSFSVTIQSHGPYNIQETRGKEYLTGDYTEVCRNAMNNYMDITMEMDRELAAFIDRLRDDPEPVVVVTFGDHLPWMGDGGIFYGDMGINFDTDTAEGFFNQYATRYLIWANNAAKEIIGHDVKGEGPAVSPCFLMNVIFDQLGWEGPAYMQAMDDIMEVMPAKTSTGRAIVDGVYTAQIPEERQGLYQDFLYLQYYWQNEFLYGDVMK